MNSKYFQIEAKATKLRRRARTRGGRLPTRQCVRMLIREELIGEEGNNTSREMICEDNIFNNVCEIETVPKNLVFLNSKLVCIIQTNLLVYFVFSGSHCHNW